MNTPAYPQIQRTLAAIVVTDAVGFSKCMSQDEDRALAMINRDLALIGELCEFFEGQILKTMGDGVLMYFVSAVQAAACAVEVQKTFGDLACSTDNQDHFVHRIGVHLGDIFFNQQDMMGTGVNIAARLESRAKPGGICMSQVVYDVVKSRLDLDASYAGELDLKNIGEAVAAYHVWPLGARPEIYEEETTEAVAPIAITPINVVIKILSEHPNAYRIKKLLYGTHHSAWENDAAIIENVPLKLLVESLIDRNAALEDCRRSLCAIVSTLNRRAEYSQVAEVILHSLQTIYAEAGNSIRTDGGSLVEETCPGYTGSDTSSVKDALATLHQDIAVRLEQTSDLVRLKKLLYCLCYEKWESDSSQVDMLSTLELVGVLHQKLETASALQNRLRRVLLRLNRKAKYAPLANLIFRECQAMYSPEPASQISMSGVSDSLEDSSADSTQINVRKKSSQPWVSADQAGMPAVS